MKMTLAKATEVVMQLGKTDRRKLQAVIDASLAPTPKLKSVPTAEDDIDESRLMHEDMTEEEVIAELNRRHEEYQRDPSCAIPAEEFEREMRSMVQ